MKSFRVKIPTLWRQATQGLVLGAFVARINLWVEGQPFSLPNTAPLMLVAAIVVVFAYFLQPTVVSASGLKAMTAWGFRKRVDWKSITEVRFARLYFMQPSLKLIDTRGRAYWIARDTKDLKGFHRLAKEIGGPDHPLTQALETPLFEL